MKIEFTKMHGLGNDFVVIDNMAGGVNLTTEQVVFLCDRHKGVGADGVILIEPGDGAGSTGSLQADCFMNYINADGSFAGMCGNGVRCTAKFVRDNLFQNKKESKTDFKIVTRTGIKEVKFYQEDETFSVNMGKPSFTSPDFEKDEMELKGLKVNLVFFGNPFAVSFVDDLYAHDFEVLGPSIENDKSFPNRMNFELVEKVNEKEYKVRVWERGCGETMACGTGSCAVYSVLRKLGNTENEITIEFPGGKLYLSEDKDGFVIMRGGAVSVFSSIIELV